VAKHARTPFLISLNGGILAFAVALDGRGGFAVWGGGGGLGSTLLWLESAPA